MKTPFKLRSGNTSSFKNIGSSPAKQEQRIDLKRKKTVPMEGAPGGDPDYKPQLKELKHRKKTLVHRRNPGPKSPSTPFKPPVMPNKEQIAKSKGTLKGITGFEYDFPVVNKIIDLKTKGYKKGIDTVKKGGKKVYDYFTKK